MEKGTLKTLNSLKSGQIGRVVEVRGGHGMINRLDSLGIRAGIKIKKISAMLLRGPITVEIGTMQLAIGFGMAKKIIVEVE